MTQVRRLDVEGNIVCRTAPSAVAGGNTSARTASVGQATTAPKQPWLAQLLAAAEGAATASTSAAV